MAGQKKSQKRLRKQPQMRRVYTANAAMVGMSLSKTAKKRQQRTSREKFSRPLASAMDVVLSARWVSLGLLALCVYALIFIGRDERFFLDYIPVEGTNSIPPTEIVAVSGLAGRHVFAADPQQAAERIGDLPGVVTATVTLTWPNDIMIRISEKPPLAVWREGATEYWIDEDGLLLPARTETVGLLEIISEVDQVQQRVALAEPVPGEVPDLVDEEAEAEAGDAGEITEQAGSASVAFVPYPVLEGALQLRALRPNIESLYYRPSGGLSYQDGRGWRAYFGDGRDMHQKLVVYETIVEDLLARGIHPEYISVSNREKPFFKAGP